MKDLGELHHFLRMQVQRNADGLFLSQNRYILVGHGSASVSDDQISPMLFNKSVSICMILGNLIMQLSSTF